MIKYKNLLISIPGCDTLYIKNFLAAHEHFITVVEPGDTAKRVKQILDCIEMKFYLDEDISWVEEWKKYNDELMKEFSGCKLFNVATDTKREFVRRKITLLCKNIKAGDIKYFMFFHNTYPIEIMYEEDCIKVLFKFFNAEYRLV